MRQPVGHYPGLRLWTALFFFFLYAPMVVLVAYSFNVNKLAMIWGGKGVGSQGDGTAQFVARSAEDQRAAIRPVVEDLIAGKLMVIEDNQVCLISSKMRQRRYPVAGRQHAKAGLFKVTPRHPDDLRLVVNDQYCRHGDASEHFSRVPAYHTTMEKEWRVGGYDVYEP